MRSSLRVREEDKRAEARAVPGRAITEAPEGSNRGRSARSSLRTPEGQAPWDPGNPEPRPGRLSSAGLWGVATSRSFLPWCRCLRSRSWGLSPRPLCSLAGGSCLCRPHVAGSPQASDLRPCPGLSAELCYFCLEAGQSPSLPGARWPGPTPSGRANSCWKNGGQSSVPGSWGL